MDLSKLATNPIVKNVLSKQLKNAMVENNVQLITIALDDNGELCFQVYDGAPVVIMEENEVIELKNTIKNLML